MAVLPYVLRIPSQYEKCKSNSTHKIVVTPIGVKVSLKPLNHLRNSNGALNNLIYLFNDFLFRYDFEKPISISIYRAKC